MLTQLSSTHGHVGDSVAAVNKLISEHSKFIETAKVCKSIYYKFFPSLNTAYLPTRNPTNMGVVLSQQLRRVDDHSSWSLSHAPLSWPITPPVGRGCPQGSLKSENV